ncbi:PKD domain-containing protein [Kribbella italica]|uniref:Uncharacterized protein n=1 Tax=Kribbella italica TaxID=1540520 RepID=A0A7W9J8B8_9ACTN|nr:PKD domain-containing protein [Kribbella italica]MBB5837484.1 hypothetical protein [Kribbella italica]
MTDELKAKFQALVKDAPEPTGLPSDAVYARIKTVRRRRTTGLVAGLATAAVATIALAAGNLTGVDSAPPVTETPNGPTPTAVATTTPTSTPTGPKSSIAVTARTIEPNNEETGKTDGPDSPPPNKPSSPKTEEPEVPAPVKLNLALSNVTVNGLKASVQFRWTGSLLTPMMRSEGRPIDAGSGLAENSFNFDYDYGDNHWNPEEGPTGKNGFGLTCDGASKRVSGSWSGRTQTHTYEKPGTYTFSYLITYCGPNGEVEIKKTVKITVKGPTASP